MIIAHQLARRNCPMVELLRFCRADLSPFDRAKVSDEVHLKK